MAGFFPDEPKRTHAEVKEPRLSLRRLADYMAASQQKRRSVIQSCKYQPVARVIQHNEARSVVANYIREGKNNPQELEERAEFIRNKLADTDFETDLNDHNADYLKRFAGVCGKAQTQLPKAEILPSQAFDPVQIGDVKIYFGPHLLLRRITPRSNKLRAGALMLRYSKGKALPENTATWQSAGIFGLMRSLTGVSPDEAERGLCVVLDAYSGKVYPAPTNSVYLFNEMKAACADIAERWPAIKPPKNAIL